MPTGISFSGPQNHPIAIIVQSHDEDEHVKEVYARFGLAVYFAQVLEHGLVNALVILFLLPRKLQQILVERSDDGQPSHSPVPQPSDFLL